MKLAPRIAAALLALGLTAAQAHNVWLLPSATSLFKPEWVTVDAAVANDLFYFNHFLFKLDHLAITAPDGSRVEPDKPFTGNLRSVFDFKPAQRGTYRVAIVNAGGQLRAFVPVRFLCLQVNGMSCIQRERKH